MSLKKLSDYGTRMEHSKQLKQKVGIGDTSIKVLPNLKMAPKQTISMQESHLKNNQMTLKDKLLYFKKPIPAMKLSKTLLQESILEDQGCSRFWKKSLEETYQKLWLPTEIDSLVLDLNFSNSSSPTSMSNLPYFKIKSSKNLLENWQQTSYQSLQFTQPDTMECENITFTRKIRFYPSQEQKVLFNKCLGASRFFYNRTVDYINKKSKKQGGLKGCLNFQRIRRAISKPDKELTENDPMFWQKDIPYDTRDQAVKDACTAFKTSLALLKANHIKKFQVNFRSKKKGTESFKINPNALTVECKIFITRLKGSKLRVRKKDVSDFTNNGEPTSSFFTIIKTKSKKWYVCLTRSKDHPVYDNAVHKSVFLDPGVRTFQTFYSPDGICGKIGDGFSKNSLEPLSDKHDNLWSVAYSKTNKVSASKKYNLRKRCAKIRDKIANKVKDLHWQTCNFLCKGFRNIFLPSFEVSEMVQDSPLGKSITRSMLSLSHYAFKQRLLWYAKTKHRNVYIVNEAYTTKTCGNCGHEQVMEGKKCFECEKCSIKIDRDDNGARNICLSVLTALL
jgi:putative transposase